MKLTPEEKAELKALKKEQKKLEKIEKKKQTQRDVLIRETKYSQITLRRHERKWRDMLIKITLPEMRNELEFAWHNFERVIDCKNFQITLLMDELEQAGEQYTMNLKNHIYHIDKLMDMFHERLDELKADNDLQCMSLIQRNEELAEEIRLTAGDGEDYLKTMLYILEATKKEENQTKRAENFSKEEEEGAKNAQMVQKLRSVLEKKLRLLWKNTLTFLSDYAIQVKERSKEHHILKGQDDDLQRLLKKRLEQIRKYYELIKRLRLQLLDSQTVLGSRLADYQIEHDFFSIAFTTLKRKLEADRQIDFEKLKQVTVNYNQSIDVLKKLQQKGEHIMHVGAVCRKLETQEEKVTPFPVATDMPEVNMEGEKDYKQCLDLFWQRVAQADASRHAINEEKEYLQTENKILKMRLHRYCQCLSCPADNVHRKGKSKHITEGVLEQKKYDMQKLLEFPSNQTIPEEHRESVYEPY